MFGQRAGGKTLFHRIAPKERQKMPRFHFNLRNLVDHAIPHAIASQHTLRAVRLGATQPDRGAAPQGPGWFDSSWELIRGLEVREGPPSDARLVDWLAAWLRADLEAASAVTQRNEQPSARLVPAAPHGALVDTLQLGDLDLAVAAEVTHLHYFGEFGIDHLELA